MNIGFVSVIAKVFALLNSEFTPFADEVRIRFI